MNLAARFLVFAVIGFQFGRLYALNQPLKPVINATARHDADKNVTHIDLDGEASRHLLKQWQDQAVSGLMAAVASRKIRAVAEADAAAHEKCVKTANDVVRHAKCVSKLLRRPVSKPTSENGESTKALFARLRPNAIHSPAKPLEPSTTTTTEVPTTTSTTTTNTRKPKPILTTTKAPVKKRVRHRFSNAATIMYNPSVRYSRRLEKLKQKRRRIPEPSHASMTRRIGSFEVIRKKRFSHRSAESYSLTPSQRKLTPIGMVAKYLMKDILKAKNKTERKPWQVMLEEVKQVNEERKKMKTRQRQRNDNMEDPYEALAFKGLDRGFNRMDIEDILSDRGERKKYFDMVKEKDPSRKMLNFLRDGIKLGHSFFGKNVSNFDEKTVKVLSPRMLSVTPEDNENGDIVDLLSPSLFSLHDNGTGLEKQLSLPNLVKGFTSADQQQWLDLIFEASNVDEHLETTRKALSGEEYQTTRKKRYQETMVDEHGNPLYFTKEKAINVLGKKEEMRIEHAEKLIKSYTPEQMKEMNQTGYTVLNKEQLKLMYGHDSPHANQVMIDGWANRSKEEVHAQIEDEIHKLAVMKSFQRRQRDIVLAPIVGGVVANTLVPPITLSPILFTVVVGAPSVLGPIVLSPWVFLPLILSPRVLSPVILSPLLFVPVVLSPLTLHPVILCPGVLNVIVLSPLTLAPFILSPQVFCPIILSPLVMSPFIVSPSIGTPLILSPFVLTPVIYSPLALMALVLSPNALSPIVESKLIIAEVVLSPSWLS
uniref:ANK_REP_REGION domain-containing protein n=1 Tax=Panagrellus redivivus TaxID=6233 RepID=A0A7E4VKX0_PANRE